MHQQPVFAGNAMYGGEVSARFFGRGICLPSGSSMSDEALERVIEAVTYAMALSPTAA